MKERAASLSFLCHCLTPGLDPAIASNIKEKITNGQVNWDHVIELANAHLVVASLWTSLCDKNLRDLVPEEVGSYLGQLHGFNQKRNAAIRRQAEEIIGTMNRAGLEPMMLKGGALLLTGTFDDPAQRIMTDLDIMVQVDELEKASELLSGLGYRSLGIEGGSTIDNAFCQHVAPVARAHDAASVEIHTNFFHAIEDPIVLTAEEAWRRSEPVTVNGLAFRVLCPTHFVLHNIVHSEAHHRGFAYGNVPVRNLLDLVFLFRVCGESIHWREIDRSMARHGLGRMGRSYVYMGSRLFGLPHFPSMWPTVGARLHYARCVILAGHPRLKAMDKRRVFLKENAARVCRLFSAARMQARFGCSDGFLDLTRTRLRYLTYLVRRFLISPKRSYLTDLLAGKPVIVPRDIATEEEEHARR